MGTTVTEVRAALLPTGAPDPQGTAELAPCLRPLVSLTGSHHLPRPWPAARVSSPLGTGPRTRVSRG